MTMKIFLIRHGRSIANEDKSVHARMADHAIPLSENGKSQAVEVGDFLKNYFDPTSHATGISDKEVCQRHPIRMWVSPYTRARQTAQIIKEHTGSIISDVRENINLVEQQFGLFDGISHEGQLNEIKKRYPNEYAYYKKCEDFEGKFWARMPLGESRFDVARRVHELFGTIKRDEARHGIDTVLIVAHGITNRAFVMQWLHLPYEWFEAEDNPKNCSVRLIEGTKDQGYIFEPRPLPDVRR
jgi:2,3-bisphosphoglycerate-dependent phosphoglycerate mutase